MFLDWRRLGNGVLWSDLANFYFNFASSKHAIFDTLDAVDGLDLAAAGARIDDPDVRHSEGQVFVDFCAHVKRSIIGRKNFCAQEGWFREDILCWFAKSHTDIRNPVVGGVWLSAQRCSTQISYPRGCASAYSVRSK